VAFEAGDAGVIVSCDMGREGKCAGEILDLFTEVSYLVVYGLCRSLQNVECVAKTNPRTQYHEKSLGRQTHQRDLEGSNDQGEDDDNQGDNSEPGDDDIETQIKKEMASLKPSSSKPRLFQRVTSSMPCSKARPSLIFQVTVCSQLAISFLDLC
jgi:tRNA acetyltransferase TAN1